MADHPDLPASPPADPAEVAFAHGLEQAAAIDAAIARLEAATEYFLAARAALSLEPEGRNAANVSEAEEQLEAAIAGLRAALGPP